MKYFILLLVLTLTRLHTTFTELYVGNSWSDLSDGRKYIMLQLQGGSNGEKNEFYILRFLFSKNLEISETEIIHFYIYGNSDKKVLCINNVNNRLFKSTPKITLLGNNFIELVFPSHHPECISDKRVIIRKKELLKNYGSQERFNCEAKVIFNEVIPFEIEKKVLEYTYEYNTIESLNLPECQVL